MARREDLPRRYEGSEVLSRLLGQAGCELSVEEVRAEFDAALEEDPDTAPGEIVPLLFETEPRPPDRETARRLYANLLGLWDRVRAERLGGSLRVLDGEAPSAPTPPTPGTATGTVVPDAHVAWVWRELVEGDPKARSRAEDRLENRQGVLLDWVRERLAERSPEAEEICLGLCVATHEAFVHAFGTARVPPVAWDTLVRAARELDEGAVSVNGHGPAADPLQPHLARHHAEGIEAALAADQDALPEEDAPEVSRTLAVVRRAFTRAVEA